MSAEQVWIKSSYSDAQGSECVEVAIAWHKSSYSDGDGSECVEISPGADAVRIRDSKRRRGPQVSVRTGAWTGFLTYIAAA
ncbi:DUF397 domain-containing protein [Streptomyces sp. URMC 124]|uniref:DUF397 domain-containing protein n=1 Tax=Streptomyces sp. URMC 124 TaxID=3423405 RepID=UPI003F1B2EF3